MTDRTVTDYFDQRIAKYERERDEARRDAFRLHEALAEALHRLSAVNLGREVLGPAPLTACRADHTYGKPTQPIDDLLAILGETAQPHPGMPDPLRFEPRVHINPICRSGSGPCKCPPEPTFCAASHPHIGDTTCHREPGHVGSHIGKLQGRFNNSAW